MGCDVRLGDPESVLPVVATLPASSFRAFLIVEVNFCLADFGCDYSGKNLEKTLDFHD